MKGHDDPDGVARPAGALEEGEPATWGPPAPDGGPTPEAVNLISPPEPGPPHTPQNCPCERNCRYYLHVMSHFDHGNAGGTFEALGLEDYRPQEHHRCCIIQPGVYLELSGDSPVLDCDRWDPFTKRELRKLEKRRKKYFAQHPKHRPVRPTDLPDLDDDLDLDDDEEEDDENESRDDSDGDRCVDQQAE